jgi:iron complex transport system permease protein
MNREPVPYKRKVQQTARYGIIGIGCILAGIGLSLGFGTQTIPVSAIAAGLFGEKITLEHRIVWDIRLPRAICAVWIGGFLAVSGALMQGVTGNPLASPSILGVNQGAALAMAIYMSAVTVPLGLGKTFWAWAGAGGGACFVFLLCTRRKGLDVPRLLLAGTALGMLLSGVTGTIALLSNSGKDLAFWIAGGLAGAAWESAAILTGSAVVLVFLIPLAPKITILSLGDEAAIGLGEQPVYIRLFALTSAAVLSGAAASVGGNIGFVCLIVPHLVRRLIGEDYRHLLPLSFIGGALLLVYGDLLARLLTSPFELPVGSFTALLGVPVLISLVRKEKRIC